MIEQCVRGGGGGGAILLSRRVCNKFCGSFIGLHAMLSNIESVGVDMLGICIPGEAGSSSLPHQVGPGRLSGVEVQRHKFLFSTPWSRNCEVDSTG